MGELSGLGVSLVDDEAGEVDFPTKINGRPAAFSWRLGEDSSPTGTTRAKNSAARSRPTGNRDLR